MTPVSLTGISKGLASLSYDCIPPSDVQQANILVSNETPPRACLAGFGFITMVFDPDKPMVDDTQLEGGALRFMSPELLVPSKFGMMDSLPTPESDIYAFGMVILQVRERDLRDWPGFKFHTSSRSLRAKSHSAVF